MSHIEKSAFRRGEYVGYAAGEVWRIRKLAANHWAGHATLSGRIVKASRLCDINAHLEAFA